jgi:hypothetical protein
MAPALSFSFRERRSMARSPDSSPARRARPTATKKAQPAPAPHEPTTPAAGAKNLLRAGLKALGEVRDDVVLRQSRIFEALLGIDTSALLPRAKDAAETARSPSDSKFDDLFDQRVARSLERLGMPSPQALSALCRQLEAINEHLKHSRATAPPAKKKAPPKRRAARKSGPR